ncbi:hypothetical protein L6164_024531 [Bauhinia variegata]|uniref:Uncharacterized protein n=1 Tax=Bauhinia variegata TaxID=167791 RepID=A0ACB9LXQ5_BAUVA|nr:hypothetical protein L6164_024531 [Bauhinia variegata]
MGKVFCLYSTGSIVVYVILGLIVTAYGFGNPSSSIPKQKVLEVERKLKQLRRHSLKTIQSEDGDIIDCVDIRKQPAFDHPALKDHKIQMAPTRNVSRERTASVKRTKSKMVNLSAEESTFINVTSQVWQKSGRCPQGTIPIRRIRKKQLLKAHSIEDYGRKKPSIFHQTAQLNRDLDSFVRENYSKAMLFAVGFRYLGAKADFLVFNPYVETEDEYSTTQVALFNGGSYDHECVEAGWAVNPGVYGDKTTRLFVYWTADGSNTTGCFDLTCPGFVQTSNEIALGAAISPISLPGDLGPSMTIYIYKDPVTSNWWVQYGEKDIGYWPPELFQDIRYNAESVEWAGEVYSTRVGQIPHTKTQMGSGMYPDGTCFDCGTFTRMRVHDNSPFLKIPEFADAYTDEYRCYGAEFMSDYLDDPIFHYGGPGMSWTCPL